MLVTMTGETLVWPDGSVFQITRSTADTGGEFLEMEWKLPPGGWAPGAHMHKALTEEYEVLDGSLDVRLAEEWRTLTAGESAAVPPGTVHTFRVGRDGATVRNVHRPALDFEPYIRMLNATFNERGLGDGSGLRALIYTVGVLQRYPQSSQAPNAALSAAVPVLGAVGRALRMRPAEPAT